MDRWATDAAKLRAGKARLGLTTGQLARRWNVAPATLRRWLDGTAPIPAMTWRVLELELERLEPRKAVRAADMPDDMLQSLDDVIAGLENAREY